MKNILITIGAILIIGAAGFGIYKYATKDKAAEPVTLSEKLKSDNPETVIADVNGQEITIKDLQEFIKTLPEQYQQMPVEVVYPQLLNEIVMARLVEEKVEELDLANDPEVIQKVEMAKKQITQNVYLQREVEKKITEGKLKTAYQDYLKKNPAQEEIRARHILLETEDEAKALIKKLEAEGGKNFAALANESSKDQGSGQNGGDLGYFTQSEMVTEFSKAAFALPKGGFSKEPVKSAFGWHVIKVEDKRNRKQPSFDDLKPQLKTQLSREIVSEIIQAMFEDADIQLYDLQGNPLNPKGETEETDNTDEATPAEDAKN
jgi:peptidyl-prolyl cis-trans isomerase C